MTAPPSGGLVNYNKTPGTTGTYENSSVDWFQSDSSRLRELDLSVTIVSILILIVTTLIGIVGNIFVFVAVYSSKLLKTVMNAMLVNLAIGDVVTAAIVAPSLLIVFVISIGGAALPEVFCSCLDFFHTLGGTVQLVSLVCISYERYQAIADPFEVEEKVRRVKISICFSWTLGLLFACLVTFWVHTTPLWLFCSGAEYDTNSYANYYADFGLGPVSFLVTFLVLFLYVKILLALKHHLEKKNKTLKKNKVQPTPPKDSTLSNTPAAGLLKTVKPEAKVTATSTASPPLIEARPKAKKGAIFWKKNVKIGPSEKVSTICNGGSTPSLLNGSAHKSSSSLKRGSFGQASVDFLVMKDENNPENETIVFVPKKQLTIKNVNNAVSFIKRTNKKVSDTKSGDDGEREEPSLLEISETGSKVVTDDAAEPEMTPSVQSPKTKSNTGGLKCAPEMCAGFAENEMTSSSDNSSHSESENTMPLLFKKFQSEPNGSVMKSAHEIKPSSKKEMLPEKPSILKSDVARIASHEKYSARNKDFEKASPQKKQCVPERDGAGVSPHKTQSILESGVADMSPHETESVPESDFVGSSLHKTEPVSESGVAGMSSHKTESVPESNVAVMSPHKTEPAPEGVLVGTSPQKRIPVPESVVVGMSSEGNQAVPESDRLSPHKKHCPRPESDDVGMSPHRTYPVPESDVLTMTPTIIQSAPESDIVKSSPQQSVPKGDVAMSPKKTQSAPERSDLAKTSHQKNQDVSSSDVEAVTSDEAIYRNVKHKPGADVLGKKAQLADMAATTADTSGDAIACQLWTGVPAPDTAEVQGLARPKKQGVVFWKKRAKVPEKTDCETDQSKTANNMIPSGNENSVVLNGETTSKKQGGVFWKKKAKVGGAVTNVTGDAAGESVSFRPGNKAPPGGENQELTDTVSFLPRKEMNNLVNVHDFDGKVMMAAARTDQVVGSVCVMSDKNKFNGKRKLEGKTAKRASVIIIVFLVCWLPLPIVYLVTGHVTNRYGVQRMINGAEMFCLCLACMTAALNPIVYGLVNKQWRNEFLRLMRKCLKKT